MVTGATGAHPEQQDTGGWQPRTDTRQEAALGPGAGPSSVGLEQNGPCQERTGRWPGGSWGPGAGRGGGAPSHPAGDAGTEARGPSPSPPRPCPARTRGHCRGRGDSLARPSPAGRPAAAFPRGPNLRATSHNVWEERRPPGPGAGRCAKVHRGRPRRAAHPHSATFPQVGWAPGARAHGGRPSLRSLLPLPEARLYTVLGSSSSRRDKGRGSRSHFHHKPGQAPALGAVLRTGGKVP